jgi:hypothetical protein
MDPLSAGVSRTLRGIRTGDRKALFGGLALMLFGVWRNRKNRPREMVKKATVKPGETLVIRGTRLGDAGREPSPPPPLQTL